MPSHRTGTRSALHRPLPAKLLRYATVSVVATTVGMTTLGLLVTLTALSPGWSNVVATVLGTVPSFEMNRRWVWARDDRRSLLRQVLPFAAMAFAELVASTLAVHAAGVWAQHHDAGHLTRTAIVEGANVAAFGVLWIAQYVVCDRLLFRSSNAGRPGGTSKRPLAART